MSPNTAKRPAGPRGLPAIVVDAAHAERLRALAEASFDRLPEVADALLGELERAKLVPSGRFPAAAVNMRSWATYTDRVSGQERRVQLVYPEDADIAQGRISVMTPIGAALLGLTSGQKMRWRTRDGAVRDLVVTAVEPAAAEHPVGEGAAQ